MAQGESTKTVCLRICSYIAAGYFILSGVVSIITGNVQLKVGGAILIALAVLLIVGIYKEKSTLVLTFLIIEGVLLVFGTIAFICGMAHYGILAFIFGTVVHALTAIVVFFYYREMVGNNNPKDSFAEKV